MRFKLIRRIWFALYLLLSSAASALAIAPHTQMISPTYDRVVRVLKDTGLGGGQGFFEGTGSVVANQNVNGDGYLWVITADHVVSVSGSRLGATASGLGIAFGNSATGSGHSTYFANTTAVPANIYRHGPTGLEDIALFAVNYGAYDPANDALAVTLAAAAAPQLNFTDIGFGNQGNFVPGGFQAQGLYGTQRYYNQRVIGVVPSYSDAFGYTYQAATFTIQHPNHPASPVGTGAGLDSDSGSPWFSTDFNGTYYTNGQFGLLTSISPPPTGGLFPFGSTERALAFSQTDIAWIASKVPEPGTASVFILTIFFAATSRRRLHA